MTIVWLWPILLAATMFALVAACWFTVMFLFILSLMLSTISNLINEFNRTTPRRPK